MKKEAINASSDVMVALEESCKTCIGYGLCYWPV